MKRRDVTDRAVAYHEAGHAVAAFKQGIGIRRISIMAEAGRDGFVHHAPVMGRYRPDWDNSPQVRVRGERVIRICLAGPAAQRKFNPRTYRHWHAQGDFEQAAVMMSYLAAPGEHERAYMRLLKIETRRLVEHNWKLIGALANELIRRRKMSGAETMAFIRNWYASEAPPHRS